KPVKEQLCGKTAWLYSNAKKKTAYQICFKILSILLQNFRGLSQMFHEISILFQNDRIKEQLGFW
ncbi:MAG: hypothetical protein L0Y73_00670, partial [Candidatus Aminicenantes bacterium]|nr:hypothetical protein [Candidatus Aminicenantes bacterium]